ncbi:MAG TPA: hypothetical protein VLJ14_06705 [Ktedonobacterales bacterium]|jgi:hypothetical protein|nr:hypothetical protein [Ktedonobacterales bacterium]
MPAKGFLGEVREAVRHFYAVDMRHEVSDANIRGYLRAASQIEDVWQQVDERIAAALAQGTQPWDAYGRMRHALAFIRAARAHQIFIRELLAADAAFDPATVGYLPPITYDQCNALCHQIHPDLQRAVAALNDPEFTPDVALPLPLGPHVEAEDEACPVTHLQGMIAAAREVREWAAGLIAQYSTAVAHAAVPVPPDVSAHVTALNARLAEADSALRFGVDLVGQASRGEATVELHEQAEDSLWDALETFFLLNQAVAMPELLRPPVEPSPSSANTSQKGATRRRRNYRDRHIRPDDLWPIAAPAARSQLRGTKFGGDEMAEMCEKMGGILSAGAQQYLDEVAAAVSRGDAYMIAAMANCPFEPLYRARRPLEIAGATIPTSHEFHWNFHRGHIETASRFGRAQDWMECEE